MIADIGRIMAFSHIQHDVNPEPIDELPNALRFVRSGSTMYRCALCGKESTQKSDMRKHLRVHTGEKPFKCTVCGKAFSVNSSWNKHMKTQHRSLDG